MFTLTFKTDNAAFNRDYPQDECARIIEDVVKQLRNGFSSGPCLDVNGNTVGRWHLNQEED